MAHTLLKGGLDSPPQESSPMRFLSLLISALFVCLGAAGCDCGSGQLVSTPDMHAPSGPMQPPVTTPTSGPPIGWCSNDCDCPSGSVCLAGQGELTSNQCQPGTNTCNKPCATACSSGSVCQNGVCTVAPCVGSSCPAMTPPGGVTVDGTYTTFYQFDIHNFAQSAAKISDLLDVLNAALNGNLMCQSASTAAGQLICLAANLIAQNIHAPAWVGQLIQVLSGVFKFGDTPVTAKGVMQLAEASDGSLSAAETWSEMWLEYNGATYNVMNSPMLGTLGTVTVEVHSFGGTRTTNEVILGPREIDMDANKLLVNLINVAITAASGGQATDVGSLLDLVLCNQIAAGTSDHVLCETAAATLASDFELDSSIGGVFLDEQRGLIYDDDNDGKADGFGRDMPVSARGSVRGSMGNGLVNGDLGAFPNSNWYGKK
jgi:hypothetical protein